MYGNGMPPWYFMNTPNGGGRGLEDIIEAKRYIDDLERQWKEKNDSKKKDEPPKKMSVLQICLILNLLAIPVFILESAILLGGVAFLVRMIKTMNM